MKKIFTLLFAAVIGLSSVNAKLIFHESFGGVNGAVGQLSAGSDAQMLIDPDFYVYDETRWWSYSGTSNFIQVEEGSLSWEGYQTKPIGNKAYLWSGGADDVRSFSSQEITSGKVYLSAIINVATPKAKADADYFLSLGDHVNKAYTCRLYAKSVQEGEAWTGFRLGVAKQNEGTSYIDFTEEVFEPGKDYLIVMEYEFVSGDKNDTVRLYVNPTKETTEPTIVCRQSAQAGSGSEQGANAKEDAHRIFGVFLRQGSNTPKVYIDEIKVATKWSDVWTEKTEDEDPGENPGENPQDSTTNNIAALVAGTAFQTMTLSSQPVVIHMLNYDPVVQDESGAVIIDDFSQYRYLENVAIGDKIGNLSLVTLEKGNYKNGLPTARLSRASVPEVISSGNEVEAFEVTMSEVAKYGPALVQLREIEFVPTAFTKFEDAGMYGIQQEGIQADMQVPTGCDLIGEDIPAKADLKALLVRNTEDGIRLRIRQSADLTNRQTETTGMESVQTSAGNVQKIIRNGQLIIERDGKQFNAQGQIIAQ